MDGKTTGFVISGSRVFAGGGGGSGGGASKTSGGGIMTSTSSAGGVDRSVRRVMVWIIGMLVKRNSAQRIPSGKGSVGLNRDWAIDAFMVLCFAGIRDMPPGLADRAANGSFPPMLRTTSTPY